MHVVRFAGQDRTDFRREVLDLVSTQMVKYHCSRRLKGGISHQASHQ